MTEKSFVVFGGGGHSRSVIDVLERLGYLVAAVVDPATSVADERVLADDGTGWEFAKAGRFLAIPAVGDNRRRRALAVEAAELGLLCPAVIAATATVGSNTTIGAGSVVLEHAHVGPFASIGTAVIVNTGAIVEHDATVGDGAHIGPRAVLAGHASCGDGAFVGAGAVVLPGVRVGAAAVVGAGSVVVSDVADAEMVAGVPARRMKS